MTPQTRALIEALEKAEQLASIAYDWNLDEVEIDGVMTRTVELEKYFQAAISSAKAAEEGVEGSDLFCKTPVWLIRRIRELEAQLAKEKAPERA